LLMAGMLSYESRQKQRPALAPARSQRRPSRGTKPAWGVFWGVGLAVASLLLLMIWKCPD